MTDEELIAKLQLPVYGFNDLIPYYYKPDDDNCRVCGNKERDCHCDSDDFIQADIAEEEYNQRDK